MMAHLAGRPIHVCHIALKEEVLLIRSAKEKVDMQIACWMFYGDGSSFVLLLYCTINVIYYYYYYYYYYYRVWQ